MRDRIFNLTSVFLFYQKAFSLSVKNNRLKRFLYQLRINFLPTILMLIISSIIALHVSELINRAKLRSNDLKPVHVTNTIPSNSQTHSFTK